MARTTDKRERILEYITQFTRENGYSPSVREICEGVGLASTATVHYHLNALRQEGHPICSDQCGYYYADNQQEINDTVCRLNSLVTKISNARSGLLFASITGDNVTVNLKITVGG